MATDAGQPVQPPQAADLWRLPQILDAQVRQRHFEPPRRVTVAGVDGLVADAVEIEVRLSEPFQIRALGPVLWVANEPLTIAESDGDVTYRFLAFEPRRLRSGGQISLSWNSPGAQRVRSRFRYNP
jgi:hypothetical protein